MLKFGIISSETKIYELEKCDLLDIKVDSFI
jgi:hypothetical protein